MRTGEGGSGYFRARQAELASGTACCCWIVSQTFWPVCPVRRLLHEGWSRLVLSRAVPQDTAQALDKPEGAVMS